MERGRDVADGGASAAPRDRAEARAAAPASADDKTPRTLEWIKAIGMPLVTLIATVFGGYYLTNLTKDREARESNERLYAQLLTQREQSDALIRKDMFGVVINRFLSDPQGGDWANKVLQLELLANNFNQSLDLAPLFKDLARRLPDGPELTQAEKDSLMDRLDLTASDLIFKQVNTLARRGLAEERVVPLGAWRTDFGKPFMQVAVNTQGRVPVNGDTAAADDAELLRFALEVIDVNIVRREVELRLRVDLPGEGAQDIDRHFWVGRYDFPMLDNTQLPYGLRSSIVMTEFFVPDTEADREANSFVKLHLVVFPAASASFKERQDYDDILLDILRAQGRSAAALEERR